MEICFVALSNKIRGYLWRHNFRSRETAYKIANDTIIGVTNDDILHVAHVGGIKRICLSVYYETPVMFE